MKAASSKSRPARTASKSKSERKAVSKQRPLRSGGRRLLKPIAPRNQTIVVEPLSTLYPELPAGSTIQDIPFSYNETKLVLMVRDPYWGYVYWDFSAVTWNGIVVFRERDMGAGPKLRIHNIDQGTFNDIDIDLDARHWYLDLGSPNTDFEVELGLSDSSGKFHGIVKSNRMRTPRNGPSETIDAQWNLSEFEFAEMYRLSGGGKTGHGSDVFSSFRRR